MNNEVLIIVADDGLIGTLMTVAKSTEQEVAALVVGSRERAEAVAKAGVSKVTWLTTDENTPVEALAPSIADIVAEYQPGLVLATNTAAARAILGAVAARLDAAMTSSVISAKFEGSKIALDRSVAERRAVESIETSKSVVAFVLDGADDLLPVDTPAPIEEVVGDNKANLTIIATHEDDAGGGNLANAKQVVGAGRGIVSKEELALVETFAKALNAELTCSLSLCDDYRWFEHSRVVGTSTQRISPRLYISVGISGQPQHMTGVRGAKTIVAINNDPEAPIFRSCAYGIVGDLTKVVPALTAALT